MLKLLKKEFKLNVHPALFLFCLLGAMTVIPYYPYIVGIGYSVMPIFIYFQFINENRALEFSSVLPVKRAHIVSASVFVIIIFQLTTVLFGAVLAYPSRLINPNGGNFVGLDCNCSFFGVAFICLGALNLTLIPQYFKTGKAGIPTILGLLAFIFTYLAFELPIQLIPALKNALDSYAAETLWARLTVLFFGIILYTVLTFAANKIAVKKFEKVNL